MIRAVIDNQISRVASPKRIRSLVVDGDSQRRILVEELLSNMGYSTLESAESIADLASGTKRLDDQNLLLVLCVDSATDHLISQLQIFLKSRAMPVLMLAENIDQDGMRNAMKSGVTAFLSLSVQGNRVKQAIDSAFANFSVVNDLQQKISALDSRLENRVTIDKAKGLVMKTKGLDESQAYSYMREYAMKNGKKLIEVAEMTIATAELLDMQA